MYHRTIRLRYLLIFVMLDILNMKLTGLTNLTNYEEKGNGKTIQNIVHSVIDISNRIYYYHCMDNTEHPKTSCVISLNIRYIIRYFVIRYFVFQNKLNEVMSHLTLIICHTYWRLKKDTESNL